MTNDLLNNCQPILFDILKERQRQEEKFGLQNHKPIEWLAILMEEVGEVSKECLEEHFQAHFERDTERLKRLRKELIEVAAVAVAMIESLERNEMKL